MKISAPQWQSRFAVGVGYELVGPRLSMRFLGKLSVWHEDRGFGFISPAEGGQDIFVHVSELPRAFVPSPDEALTFEVAMNPQGKKKAVRVQQVRVPQRPTLVPARDWRGGSSAPRPMAARRAWRTYVVLPVLLILVGVFLFRWTGQRSAGVSEAGYPATGSVPQAVAASPWRCDGRTMCSQMTSCAEATFFLKNCPGTKMDGNNDGVPCETQWCK